jgi:hypothetical protein
VERVDLANDTTVVDVRYSRRRDGGHGNVRAGAHGVLGASR